MATMGAEVCDEPAHPLLALLTEEYTRPFSHNEFFNAKWFCSSNHVKAIASGKEHDLAKHNWHFK